MPVDARLMELIVCPACRAALRELPAERGLECSGCGRVYPVREGIPILLIAESSQPENAGTRD